MYATEEERLEIEIERLKRRLEVYDWIDKYGSDGDSFHMFLTGETISKEPGLVWYYQRHTWGGPPTPRQIRQVSPKQLRLKQRKLEEEQAAAKRSPQRQRQIDEKQL